MKAPPKRAKLFDVAVPFFLPVWRRILAVTIPVLWGLFEFSAAEPLWRLIFVGMGGIAGWRFYIADWAEVAAQAEEDA